MPARSWSGRCRRTSSSTPCSPAAVGSRAKEGEAAKALIKFLTAPAAAAVLKAKGLEPG